MSGSQWFGVALVALGVALTSIPVMGTIEVVRNRRMNPDLVPRSRYFIVWIGWAIWGLPEFLFGVPLLFPGGADWMSDVICTLLPSFQAC